jgi:hypothetical protein
MDAHTLIALECWHTLLPEGHNSDIMSSCGKLNAEITYMAFFSTDNGWIELCEH